MGSAKYYLLVGIKKFIHGNNRLIDWLGQGIIWLIPAMVILINLAVVIRYSSGQGSVLLQEAVLYLHATAFMLGLTYTLKHDKHVRVDLFYSGWSPKSQAWVNMIGHSLFLLPVALLIGLSSLSYVATSWSILEGSPEADGIPAVFLLKTLLPLSALLLLLQGMAGVGASILQIWYTEEPD